MCFLLNSIIYVRIYFIYRQYVFEFRAQIAK